MVAQRWSRLAPGSKQVMDPMPSIRAHTVAPCFQRTGAGNTPAGLKGGRTLHLGFKAGAGGRVAAPRVGRNSEFLNRKIAGIRLRSFQATAKGSWAFPPRCFRVGSIPIAEHLGSPSPRVCRYFSVVWFTVGGVVRGSKGARSCLIPQVITTCSQRASVRLPCNLITVSPYRASCH